MADPHSTRTKAFISYSHVDEKYRQRLRIHLQQYIREQNIEVWDDTRIQVGAIWKDEIKQAIASAKVAILLISADFLASDFIANDELPPLLEAAEKDGLIISSVILSSCGFKNTKLAQYQAFNNPSEPLMDLSKSRQEAIWAKLAEQATHALAPKPLNEMPSRSMPPQQTSGNFPSAGKRPAMPRIGTTLLTFKGHSKRVSFVSWSPDGKYIVSGGDDKAIHVWEATTGTSLLTYSGHSRPSAAAWSPDSKRIASASGGIFGGNDSVHIWDAITGQPLLTCKGHSSPKWALAWSPDGTRIAVGSRNNTIQIFETSGGELVSMYKTPSAVMSVAWSPDGTHLASASGIIGKKAVQVWDVPSGTLLLTYQGHTGDAHTVAWSHDGTRIASGGDDHTVQIWNAFSGQPLLTCRGHVGNVYAAAWSPGGKYIASGSTDDTVEIWDALSGQSFFTYRVHENYVFAVAWSPDGTRISSGGDDHTVQIWVAVE